MGRVNCHSAFKHYEMFHSRGGDVINIGSNNTTIFNCGGSHLGGFWGGFGLGLGNAFGSLFGGGYGFGGFPMFGGFGMGNFGFGSPFGGGWGNWGWGNGGSNRTGASNSNNKTSESTTNLPTLNKDRKALADLITERKKLTDKPGGATPEEMEAFNKKVADAKAKAIDETSEIDNQDKTDFDNLLFKVDKQPSKVNTTPAAAANTNATTGTAPSENTGEVDRTGFENIPGLSADDIKTLKDLGIKEVPIDNGKYGLSFPKELSAENLKKLKAICDKHNVPVAAAYNSRAKNIDHWIAGSIDNIQETNGKISYDINCSNFGSFGLTYSAQQNDNGNWTVAYKSGSYQNDLWTKPQDKYTYNTTNQCLSIDNGDPVISTKEVPGYETKIPKQ